jgi:cob(I)alamin adenosyltransferase
MALGKGYVQVYTGNGKGKTTAALGLALRAAGAGMRVFFAQFAKGVGSSELWALALLSARIDARQYGLRGFIKGKPRQEEITAARKGLAEARKAILSGRYQVAILDEANVAVRLGLFSVEELLDVIDCARGRVEVVITGRGAHRKTIERADLVTEMRQIRHYFAKGVRARKGIET